MRIFASRGFRVFAVLMLVGWVVYTGISITIGFGSDTVWAIGTVLAWIVLPFSPVAYVVAGIFRPPAPFRAGMLMGIIATLANVAYFAIDNLYWTGEPGFDPDSGVFYYDGGNVSLLGMVAIVVSMAVFGGICTAITAWVAGKVRGPRHGDPSSNGGSRRTPAGTAASPGSPSLEQRLLQLDDARRAGLITDQEYVWRRTEIVSQA